MTADETSTTEGTSAETAEPDSEGTSSSPDIEAAIKAATRKANKEAETLRRKLQEYEDRDKSELQKAIERAEEAERKAAQAELRGVRSDIAREMGVPPRFVVGDTEDEMRAAAKEYLDDREQAAKDRARKAEVDQGVRGTTDLANKKPDINTLIRTASGRA